MLVLRILINYVCVYKSHPVGPARRQLFRTWVTCSQQSGLKENREETEEVVPVERDCLFTKH